MNAKNIVVAIIVIILVAGGVWWYLNGGVGSPASGNTLVVPLAAQNNSGESGTATFAEVTKTVNGAVRKVVELSIKITGEPAGASQPAHIHIGSCAKLGSPVYPLTTVVNGTSVTSIDTTLAAIQAAKQPLAINLHQSAKAINNYVACGDIPLAAPTSSAK